MIQCNVGSCPYYYQGGFCSKRVVDIINGACSFIMNPHPDTVDEDCMTKVNITIVDYQDTRIGEDECGTNL